MESVYKCPFCGRGTDFKWECTDCADSLGGDGQDD